MSTSMRGESNKSTRKENVVGGGGGSGKENIDFDKTMIAFAIFFVFGCFIQKDHDPN